MDNNNPTLFISDLHLNEKRPDITQAFIQFCETKASNAQALYILGDLSDAWLGDDDDSEIAALLRVELKKLTSKGVQVSIMTGNRDFLMGEQFAQDCNCQLLRDPTVIDLYGRPALLMHGDSLCTGDQEYMAFREQIQNPQMQQLLLSKSLDERRGIAKMLRENSKSANATKATDIMDVTQADVERALSDNNVSLLIHGHTHRPQVHNFTISNTNSQTLPAQRYVLGDWDTLGWCLTVNNKAGNSDLTLASFPL